MAIKVKFIDSGREPQCKPDPKYPKGKYVDIAEGKPSCEVKLPYPAPRCGVMAVSCEECKTVFAFTVAGRVDDPHTVRVPCKIKVH